ncbi:hypothetical protein GUITHDRAFT_111749 [Guillardia theta CCMP2712]|uniref:DEP domain-containing protein n=2 Tax=Guillardia theta TaxID=55529 RepID=L1J0X6_GUITC|nr:hypothetical protein GUITHDRAFT_111749 [Guillardia theta CCMP2712]EKX42183.1 hypothetical protein GUITHDRAFT_111749 [Guillardia theta CCMP2712]|eukprot:XP_005829163.1 hypothetical protein GUITHDRAFT_111749 [Guillardia theta CCMP2712]
MKDSRGNNIGDSRYTTNYAEDLKPEVEELPPGTSEEFLRDVAQRLKSSPLVRDLESGRIKFRNSVVGTEVVDWMVKQRIAKDRRVAVAYGRQLIRLAEIVHCTRGHDFKDEELFYRFVSDYEKGLINPKTPYQYAMRVLSTPPILFAGIVAFLVIANIAYLFKSP